MPRSTLQLLVLELNSHTSSVSLHALKAPALQTEGAAGGLPRLSSARAGCSAGARCARPRSTGTAPWKSGPSAACVCRTRWLCSPHPSPTAPGARPPRRSSGSGCGCRMVRTPCWPARGHSESEEQRLEQCKCLTVCARMLRAPSAAPKQTTAERQSPSLLQAGQSADKHECTSRDCERDCGAHWCSIPNITSQEKLARCRMMSPMVQNVQALRALCCTGACTGRSVLCPVACAALGAATACPGSSASTWAVPATAGAAMAASWLGGACAVAGAGTSRGFFFLRGAPAASLSLRHSDIG